MALKCRCICGCKLLVASDSAGKRIKCPKCERKLRVPVDLVEKRRAQLDARKPPPPPRTKIGKPLSSLLDLPEPEPPPIQLDVNEPVAAKDRPSEPTTLPAHSQPATPPAATSPAKLAASRSAAAVPPEPAARPDKLLAKAESPPKPPPLPKRSEPRAAQLSTSTNPAKPAELEKQTIAENPAATVADNVAPMPLPARDVSNPASDAKPKVEDAAEAPQLETDDVELPVQGYQADRDKVATVRWLATAILLTGLVGTLPAIADVVEHSLSETSEGLSRWACALLLIGVLHCAYAVYLIQLPDWSSVWVVTFFTLAIAAGYAAMFGLTLLSTDQGHFVQLLDLADRLRGGKASAWCFIMLSLLSLTSYFSGRVGASWRNAFVG